MSALLILSTVLTAQIPTQAVAITWGALLRSTTLAGSWSVTTGDRAYRGDWIVIDRDVTSHRFGMRRWAHLVSTDSSDRCAIALDEPGHLVCEHARVIEHLRMPAAIDLAHPIASAITREHCEHGSCRPITIGQLTVAAQPRSIAGALAVQLFERVHHMSLAQALGATRVRPLVLKMPYRMVTQIPGEGTLVTLGTSTYANAVIVGEAMIDLAATPEPAITVSEVERYVEDCGVYSGSCSLAMPMCVRRSTGPAVTPGDAKLRPTRATARR